MLGVWAMGHTTAYGQAFVHPGCLSKEADFLRMQTKVQAGAHPWIDGWNIIASGLDETYQDHAQTEVYRNANGGNFQFLSWDANAVYVLSLKWKITGETKYADAGVRVLMAWANKCRRIMSEGPRPPRSRGRPTTPGTCRSPNPPATRG